MSREKVALVIACYNGRSILEEKVANCLALNYPKEKLDIVFVTDGSFMTSSACQNPSLTYMAMTARAADYAVSELKKGNV